MKTRLIFSIKVHTDTVIPLFFFLPLSLSHRHTHARTNMKKSQLRFVPVIDDFLLFPALSVEVVLGEFSC